MSDPETPPDELDIHLRSADVVARRFIVVNSVTRRLAMDRMLDTDHSGFAFDLREWLRAEGLWDEATADERAILSTSLDDPETAFIADLELEVESLATLGWALKLIPTPSVIQLVDMFDAPNEIPAPWDKTTAWIASQSVQPELDIVVMREFADLWYWRLSVEPHRRTAQGRELMEIERSIRDAAHEATAAGLLEGGKQGGFNYHGTPITRMNIDDVIQLSLAEMERLLALNWLCGYGEDWDNVPLDI